MLLPSPLGFYKQFSIWQVGAILSGAMENLLAIPLRFSSPCPRSCFVHELHFSDSFCESACWGFSDNHEPCRLLGLPERGAASGGTRHLQQSWRRSAKPLRIAGKKFLTQWSHADQSQLSTAWQRVTGGGLGCIWCVQGSSLDRRPAFGASRNGCAELFWSRQQVEVAWEQATELSSGAHRLTGIVFFALHGSHDFNYCIYPSNFDKHTNPCCWWRCDESSNATLCSCVEYIGCCGTGNGGCILEEPLPQQHPCSRRCAGCSCLICQ